MNTWPALQRQREREKGHLMGRMDSEGECMGGRAKGRSGRQLLGHCLPGVCTSVISQPLSSLASYRHAHIPKFTHSHKCNPPNTDSASAPPSLSCRLCLLLPCSDSVEQVRFIEVQALYIDTVTSCQHLQAASLSIFDRWCLALRGRNVTQEKLTERKEIPCSLVLT